MQDQLKEQFQFFEVSRAVAQAYKAAKDIEERRRIAEAVSRISMLVTADPKTVETVFATVGAMYAQ